MNISSRGIFSIVNIILLSFVAIFAFLAVILFANRVINGYMALVFGGLSFLLLAVFFVKEFYIARYVMLAIFLPLVGLSGYLVWKSISTPIDFMKQKERRYTMAKIQLEDIKHAQVAYKAAYSKFTPSLDSLILFINNDSIELITYEGQIPDSLIELGRIEAEKEALRLELISYDTTRIAVRDSLFGASDSAFANRNRTRYKLFGEPTRDKYINNLKYVPLSKKKNTYEMNAKTLNMQGLKVPVFEVYVRNTVLLKGLDRQEIINLDAEQEIFNRFKGLKVGSLNEPTLEGSWR